MPKKVIDYVDKDIQKLARDIQKYLSSTSSQLIISSPNGTRYRVIVADNGTISTEVVS
jgi:hypothetical protein